MVKRKSSCALGRSEKSVLEKFKKRILGFIRMKFKKNRQQNEIKVVNSEKLQKRFSKDWGTFLAKTLE